MLTIKIQNNRKYNDHILSDLTDGIMNETLEATKKHLETEFKDAVCDVHKSETKGTIILKSENQKTEIELYDFCCDEFKSKFEK